MSDLPSAAARNNFAIVKLAALLTGVAREHGLPNAVGPAELEAMWNAPYAAGTARLLIGNLLTTERAALNAALTPSGVRVASYGNGPDGRKRATLVAVEGGKGSAMSGPPRAGSDTSGQQG